MTKAEAPAPSSTCGPQTSNISTGDVDSIDAIIRAAYDVISGPAGQKRDWARQRSLFIPGARLIPTGAAPGASESAAMPQVLDLEAYIARVEPYFEKNGFYEKEIARRTEQFGKIVHVFSTTNRAIARMKRSPSCGGSIAFSCSMTETAGG
jgi:hypothetical protein